jgi:hypothetical protein
VERLMFVAARHRARISERGWTEGFTQKRPEGTSDEGYGQLLIFVVAYLTQPSGGSGQRKRRVCTNSGKGKGDGEINLN